MRLFTFDWPVKNFLALIAVFCLCCATIRAQQAGDLDSTFNTGDAGYGFGFAPGPDEIRALAVQPDGKILIGGVFTSLHGTLQRRIARLNPDGTPDTTFTSGITVAGSSLMVLAIALQPDGKIMIAGNFSYYNSVQRNKVARLHPDGSLDLTFDPGNGPNNDVTSVAVQNDGKILIGGFFNLYDGSARNRLARLNADGTLDPTFLMGSGVTGSIHSISIQPDQKIIIAGVFHTYNGTPRNRIARLNSNGTVDTTFDPGMGPSATVLTTALQPDGKIVIGGWFVSYAGVARNRVARINSNGTLDTGFNPGAGASYYVYAAALQTDGKVVIGGDFTSVDGEPRNRLARLHANGALDMSYDVGAGANGIVYAVAEEAGEMIIGGAFKTYDHKYRTHVGRINTDGSLHLTFYPGTGAVGAVEAIALQPDGRILIAGQFTAYNGSYINFIARIFPDGSLDTSFDPGIGPDNPIKTIALQADGKIVLGGYFENISGVPRSKIARLNDDGSLDLSFDPGTGFDALGNLVYTITLQADGKILVGGNMTSYNGNAVSRLVRLHPNGAIDAGFAIGAGANNVVENIIVQPDAKILLGGHFTTFNGSPANRLLRIEAGGATDAAFTTGTGPSLGIDRMALQPDGKIVIAGSFTNYNGTPRARLARINSDGTLDTGFDPGLGASMTPNFGSFMVSALGLQANGKIIIGGKFTLYNGTPRARLARLNTDGSLDTTFDPGSGPDQQILSMAVQPDQHILIGGYFTNYRGTGRNNIARVIGATPPAVSIDIANPDTLCQGETFSVPFTASGVFNAGNIFTAQLSDAAGSFAGQVTVGSQAGTGSGIISATIPALLPAGTGYRIRVVASDPVAASPDNGADIVVNALPVVTVTASATSVCAGAPVLLVAAGAQQYTWNTGQTTASLTILPTTAATYRVTGISNGCAASDSVLVQIIPAPLPPTLWNNGPLCEGEMLQLSAVPASGSSYSWIFPNGSAHTGIAHNFAATSGSAGTYSVTQTVNGCSSQAALMQVAIHAAPQVTVTTADAEICSGESTMLTAAGGVTYSWLPAPGLPVLTGSQVTVNPQSTTSYFVHSISAGGCSSNNAAEILVEVHEPAFAGNDLQLACGETSRALEAKIPATGTGNWQINSGSGGSFSDASLPATLFTGQPGQSYNLTWTLQNGCGTTSDEILLAVPAMPEVNAGPGVNIIAGESTQLTATGSTGTYNWSPAASLSDAGIANPVASPSETTTYVVTLSNAEGCTATGDVTVTVTPSEIVIPNIFTPNADGKNDFWEISGLSAQYPACEIFVFNRWGNTVFTSTGYTAPWDGKINGDELPAGTYFYSIHPSPGQQIRKGTLTILR